MNGSHKQCASGLLKIAVRRMVKVYPFHAHLLLQDRFICSPEVGTIGVTIRNAKLQFLYAPAFVSSCEFDELVGVLHHEVNHVLFEHLLAQPNDFPDRNARTIAEEVTVNEWITEPLPGTPITLAQFPDLSTREDTATRYGRLAQENVQDGQKTVQTGRKIGPSVRETAPTDRQDKSEGPNFGVEPLDNHDIWEDARQNPAVGKLVIVNALRQARHALDDREWGTLPDQLRHQIEDILVGTTSSNSLERIESQPVGTVNWKRELRQVIAKTLERRPALHRVPRRFPELVGVVPGRSPTFGRHSVMAVIDTSASMDADLLEKIGGELRHLSRECDITIVECDSKIQAVYSFQDELTEVHGRGGTDLRPPFVATFLVGIQPDIVVYFTDGKGPAPETPPSMPTIWCLLSEVIPAGWGKLVFVDKH